MSFNTATCILQILIESILSQNTRRDTEQLEDGGGIIHVSLPGAGV